MSKIIQLQGIAPEGVGIKREQLSVDGVESIAVGATITQTFQTLTDQNIIIYGIKPSNNNVFVSAPYYDNGNWKATLHNFGTNAISDLTLLIDFAYFIGGGNSDLPIASNTRLGGIKVGNNLSIDASGVLSASGGGGGDVPSDTIPTEILNLSKETSHTKGLVLAHDGVPLSPQDIAYFSYIFEATISDITSSVSNSDFLSNNADLIKSIVGLEKYNDLVSSNSLPFTIFNTEQLQMSYIHFTITDNPNLDLIIPVLGVGQGQDFGSNTTSDKYYIDISNNEIKVEYVLGKVLDLTNETFNVSNKNKVEGTFSQTYDFSKYDFVKIKLTYIHVEEEGQIFDISVPLILGKTTTNVQFGNSIHEVAYRFISQVNPIKNSEHPYSSLFSVYVCLENTDNNSYRLYPFGFKFESDINYENHYYGIEEVTGFGEYDTDYGIVFTYSNIYTMQNPQYNDYFDPVSYTATEKLKYIDVPYSHDNIVRYTIQPEIKSLNFQYTGSIAVGQGKYIAINSLPTDVIIQSFQIVADVVSGQPYLLNDVWYVYVYNTTTSEIQDLSIVIKYYEV